MVGRNALRKRSGEVNELEGRIQFRCHSGEAVIIQTPSGGGFGELTVMSQGAAAEGH